MQTYRLTFSLVVWSATMDCCGGRGWKFIDWKSKHLREGTVRDVVSEAGAFDWTVDWPLGWTVDGPLQSDGVEQPLL